MIETINSLATKCNIHSVSCRFFECAAGVFKGSVRMDVKLRLEAFARGLLKNMAANGSQLNDVFCLSANFIFQHELQRQKILFKVLLYAAAVNYHYTSFGELH